MRGDRRAEKLLDTSDVVKDLQDNRNTLRKAGSALNATLGPFREHAEKSFKALSKAWNCNCWAQHRSAPTV